MIRARVLAQLAVLLALASAAGAAPSFDCTKARSDAERMICGEPSGEPSLQWFDRQLARLFKVVLEQTHSRARAQLVSEQHRFLAARDMCGVDYACVLKAYERRLAALAARANIVEAYAKYTRRRPGVGNIWIVRFGYDAGVNINAFGPRNDSHLCLLHADNAVVTGKGLVKWRGQGANVCRVDVIPEGDDMRIQTKNCEDICSAHAVMDGLYARAQ